jgi:hypothetical protein
MKSSANRRLSRLRKSGLVIFAVAVALAGMALAARISYAQGEASIWGVVTDASGASIPAATVKVQNLDTGSVRNLVSDAEGHYDALLLTVGTYGVTVEKSGFPIADQDGHYAGGWGARAGGSSAEA